jgi:predicted acylesterase/phospholipase RssA/CRP-like cAMP-binding protein
VVDTLTGPSPPNAEFLKVLESSPFFRYLPEEWLDLLSCAAESRRFAAGEILQPAGSISPRLYLVARGEVEVFRGEDEQEREIIGSAMPGAVFGTGPVTNESELASYRAAGEVETWTWDRERLELLRRTVPALRDQLRCRISILSRQREIILVLSRSAVFHNTSPALLRRLLEAATLAKFAAGENICRQGEEGKYLFLVVQGEVEVVRQSPDCPAPQALAILRRGDCFGEMSLVEHSTRNAFVNALVDSEILIISKREFEVLYRSCASFRGNIQALAHERLRNFQPDETPEPVWLVTSSGIKPDLLAGFLSEALNRGGARVLVLRIDDPARPEQRANRRPGGHSEVVHFDSLTAETVMRKGFDYVLCYDAAASSGAGRRVLRDLNPTVLFIADNFARRLPDEIGAGQIVHYVQLLDSTDGRLDWGDARRGAMRAAIPVPALARALDLDELPDAARSFFYRLARLLARQRVGVALGGGGAWGWAHCALLKGLHRAGIPVDLVAGVSFGSIVGAFYASQGLAGLDRLIAAMPELSRALFPAPITTVPAQRFLARHLAAGRLEELDVPFMPVAVDIRTGAEKIFRSGPIFEAVRASCSFPGVLAPVVSGRVRYIDACVKNNVPASCLLEEGVDFVVASSVVPPPAVKLPSSGETALQRVLARLSPFSRLSDTLRSMQLMLSDMGSRQASLAAVTFAPDLSEFGMTEIKRGAEVIQRAEDQLPRFLEEVSDSFRAFCSTNPHQRS